ncbi:hypothetical protein D3C74_214810 [compost metagenome]
MRRKGLILYMLIALVGCSNQQPGSIKTYDRPQNQSVGLSQERRAVISKDPQLVEMEEMKIMIRMVELLNSEIQKDPVNAAMYFETLNHVLEQEVRPSAIHLNQLGYPSVLQSLDRIVQSNTQAKVNLTKGQPAAQYQNQNYDQYQINLMNRQLQQSQELFREHKQFMDGIYKRMEQSHNNYMNNR